jgi:hypothetical protein
MQDAKTLVQIAMRHRLSCWIIQRGDDVSNALEPVSKPHRQDLQVAETREETHLAQLHVRF